MGNSIKHLNMSSSFIDKTILDKENCNISCYNCHKRITKKNPYIFTLHGNGKYNNKIFCSDCLIKYKILVSEYK